MLTAFLASEKLSALQGALKNNESILIEQLWNAPKALTAALAQQATGKNILILTGASQEEIRLFQDFSYFTTCKVVDFPAWETLPSEELSPSPDIVGERYQVLHHLVQRKEPLIILSSLQACLQKLIPATEFTNLFLSLRRGDLVSFEELTGRLTKMGYVRQTVATEKGEFAIRGGIIDIFPVSSPDPYRLEFWGNELESLRLYDPIGQKSVKLAEELILIPAQERELIKDNKSLVTILDYLGENTLVIFDDLLALEDRYASLTTMITPLLSTFETIANFMERLIPLQKIFWTQQPIEELSSIKLPKKLAKNFYSTSLPLHPISFNMFNLSLTAYRWLHSFMTLTDYLLPDEETCSGYELFSSLDKLKETEFHLYFICPTEAEQTNLQKKIQEAKLSLPQKTTYSLGYLSSGLVSLDTGIFLFPLTEMTRRYQIRRQKQRSTYHTLPSEVYDLVAGEIVVHINHGIGKYLGIEKKPNHMGIAAEFFVLEFADQIKLYVPLNQSYLISKYIGASEEVPRLHTIGSSRWKKTREQTEQAIIKYAADLLQLYAKRDVQIRVSYPFDSADLKAFEEAFPYHETEDQLSAIASIKTDLLSSKPMERLICGDVGYGKTEVAMRAAFKVVVDGYKQVAVLVPTTVLAMQHYENFCERMSNFPITVEVLSRFRTPKQIKKTLENIAKGAVDIVIGTHRLISEDVVFKDLGLIIIDEEQRFGVKAKEHLKKIRTGIDCLTLSATPIPRTLYMSLIGARDMSVISTPPQERLPITTLVVEPHDQLLKNALLRELARDGQAYIIHNRVESIYDRANHIKKLLPQARVVVGHGQMSTEEIDAVFHAFKSGAADILVATTIVENGIDIPNANTILIDRADTFGLADLYQLRGRVGRWNRRAYAYLLVPRLRSLPELSRKRLEALAESSGYGGGMKIAMRDLALRGAGNILGLEQSGHVANIGFTLYCKLLKRTLDAMQGKGPTILCDTRLEFPIDARLPEEYIDAVSLRMEIYQRLGSATSLEELEGLWAELQDRFGTAPLPAIWLYYMTRLRVYCSAKGYLSVKLDKVALHTEQQKGKQTIVRKILFSLPKTPQELEQKILALL